MLIVVSPAKSLDFETPVKTEMFSKPAFLSEATELVRDLKKLHPEELQELMGISETLAAENFSRYSNWHTPLIWIMPGKLSSLSKGMFTSGSRRSTLEPPI